MSTPVGLYAVLAYDASDFVDLIIESDTAVLMDLSLMLRLPNPKHDANTRELNAIGAGMVKGVLAKRGVAEPVIPVAEGK